MELNLFKPVEFVVAWRFGVRFPAGARLLLFPTVYIQALGPTWPPIPWIPRSCSLGVKRPVREADHSTHPSAEVKNGGAILSFPP
jgi:hypothetical protein